jgi:hypothetical protein
MVRQHQTSDVQLHIGESRDSGFDASHRPGMTVLDSFVAPSRASRHTPPPVMPLQFSESVVIFRHTFAISPRVSREFCQNVPPSQSEGVGNAGRPMHPQPRVRMG